MPLKNIECQLAQGQLNRYMGGDGLSESALEQLEGHIRECEDCAVYLDEKKRALQAMIDPPAPKAPSSAKGTIPTHAVVEFPDDEDESPGLANSFLATLSSKRAILDKVVRPAATATKETAPSVTPNSFVKPLLYSLGLAAILIGMSALMRDPTRVLGDRVAKSNPEALNTTPAKPEPEPKTGKTEPDPEKTIPVGSASTDESATTPNTTTDTPISKPDETTNPPTSTPERSVVDPDTKPKPKAPATSSRPNRTANRPSIRNTSTARRTASRRSNSAPANATNRPPKPKGSGIRIYDGDGQPIAD